MWLISLVTTTGRRKRVNTYAKSETELDLYLDASVILEAAGMKAFKAPIQYQTQSDDQALTYIRYAISLVRSTEFP